jgi:Metallo-peptidase family M12B Reprolysin-like/Putative binding domain, N-terminal/Viral BACON domain
MNCSSAANFFDAPCGEHAFAYRQSTTRRWLSSFILCVIAGLGLFAASPTLAAGPPAGLLLPPSASDVARYALGTIAPEPGVVRQRPVTVNFPQLDSPGGAPAEQMVVDLFDGQQIAIDLDRVETRASNNYTWYGRVRGHSKSYVILTVTNGDMAGTIDLGDLGNRAGGRYQVNSSGNGLHLLKQIEPTAFPPDHPPGIGDMLAPTRAKIAAFGPSSDSQNWSAALSVDAKADSASTIDVMVVYTNQTAATVGTAVSAQIQQAVDTANAVYANSGITTRLRLVYSGQVNYSESGDFTTDLNWIVSDSTVAGLRNTYGADLVSMFVENGQYCGMGWVGPAAEHAFTVVNRGCASGNYSFPHEIGHNFGARHDIYVDANNTPYAYGHGYVDCLQGWRDVMAYPSQCGGTRIPYFSNPNMTYGSPPDPLGIATSADVTRVHNQNALSVANFRPATTGSSGSCTYALSPNNASFSAAAGGGSISVTAGSGCAWNTASSASWVTIGAGSGTSASGTINYSVAANSGLARTATISIGGQAFTISQAAGCTYSLSPTSASVPASGASGTTSVTATSGCAWNATSSAAWLTVSSSAGTGSATIGYVAAANSGGARSANLTIGDATFLVTQDAAVISSAGPAVTLSTSQIQFGNVQVGKTSRPKSVTLSNSGGGTLSITSLTSGGANPTEFALSGSCAAGTALASGQSCSLQYVFAPTGTGARSATLDVGTTAGTVTLNLTGNGTTPRTHIKLSTQAGALLDVLR